MRGEIVAVCRSEHKGTRKSPVASGFFKEDWGLVGDAPVQEPCLTDVACLVSLLGSNVAPFMSG